MTSEWFNMLLSLYKRQHHIKSFRGPFFHFCIIPHHEWPLNGLICCCFFIRDSTILNHSRVIQPSFKTHLGLDFIFLFEWHWNDQMMAEWQVFQNSVFSALLKTASFLLIPSFFRHLRMTRNDNHNWEISFNCHSSHFHIILCNFVIYEWWWNDGMRWNEGIYFNKGKTLNFKIHLIPTSFRHSKSISYSWHDHSFHLLVIPSSRSHSGFI